MSAEPVPVRAGPKPLPQGPNKLLFYRTGHLTLIDPDGKNEKKAVKIDDTVVLDSEDFRLSPDGKQIAAIAYAERPDAGGDFLKKKIVVRELGKDGPGTDLGAGKFVFWSGDGTELLIAEFTYDAPGGAPTSSHTIVNLATKARTAVKLPADHMVSDWSRDGKFFLTTQSFTSNEGKSTAPRVWVMNRDGTEHKALTDGKRRLCAREVLPDGKRVLFMEIEEKTDRKLSVIDLATGKATPVEGIPLDADLFAYCWSPDGKRIAYTWRRFPRTPGSPARTRRPSRSWSSADADGKNAKTVASEKGGPSRDAIGGSTGGDRSPKVVGHTPCAVARCDGTRSVPTTLSFHFLRRAGGLAWIYRVRRFLPRSRGVFGMPTAKLNGIVTHLGRGSPDAACSATDGELLARFVATRDEPAFAELVRRHGRLVFGVCRRVTGNHHLAEDAFQAVFVVLATKAAAIRPPAAVAAWLHGVACRTALRARTMSDRRRRRETAVGHTAGSDVRPRRTERRTLSQFSTRRSRGSRSTTACRSCCANSKGLAARTRPGDSGSPRERSPAGSRPPVKHSRTGCVIGASCCRPRVFRPRRRQRAGASPPPALAAKAAAAASPPELIPAPVAALSHGVLRIMFLDKLKTVVPLAAVALGLVTCAALAAQPGSNLASEPPKSAAGSLFSRSPNPFPRRPSRNRCHKGRTSSSSSAGTSP